jgi:hypothetical protein
VWSEALQHLRDQMLKYVVDSSGTPKLRAQMFETDGAGEVVQEKTAEALARTPGGRELLADIETLRPYFAGYLAAAQLDWKFLHAALLQVTDATMLKNEAMCAKDAEKFLELYLAPTNLDFRIHFNYHHHFRSRLEPHLLRKYGLSFGAKLDHATTTWNGSLHGVFEHVFRSCGTSRSNCLRSRKQRSEFRELLRQLNDAEKHPELQNPEEIVLRLCAIFPTVSEVADDGKVPIGTRLGNSMIGVPSFSLLRYLGLLRPHLARFGCGSGKQATSLLLNLLRPASEVLGNEGVEAEAMERHLVRRSDAANHERLVLDHPAWFAEHFTTCFRASAEDRSRLVLVAGAQMGGDDAGGDKEQNWRQAGDEGVVI